MRWSGGWLGGDEGWMRESWAGERLSAPREERGPGWWEVVRTVRSSLNVPPERDFPDPMAVGESC